MNESTVKMYLRNSLKIMKRNNKGGDYIGKKETFNKSVRKRINDRY